MRGFNLSRLAVGHPALILFFILMLGAAGTLAYLRLGRAEDPNFTIKVAVVSAAWPGATLHGERVGRVLAAVHPDRAGELATALAAHGVTGRRIGRVDGEVLRIRLGDEVTVGLEELRRAWRRPFTVPAEG